MLITLPSFAKTDINRLVSRFVENNRLVIQSLGMGLEVVVQPEIKRTFTRADKGKILIFLGGDIINHRSMRPEMVTLALCHELGHHVWIGHDKRKKILSSEPLADLFATRCFEGHSGYEGPPLPDEIKHLCEKKDSGWEGKELCLSFVSAAYGLAMIHGGGNGRWTHPLILKFLETPRKSFQYSPGCRFRVLLLARECRAFHTFMAPFSFEQVTGKCPSFAKIACGLPRS